MAQCDFSLLDLENERKITNLLFFPGQSFNLIQNFDNIMPRRGGGMLGWGVRVQLSRDCDPQENAFY